MYIPQQTVGASMDTRTQRLEQRKGEFESISRTLVVIAWGGEGLEGVLVLHVLGHVGAELGA